MLGGGIGGSGVVLAGERGSLVILLLMELVPLTHGIGISVVLRVVIVVEKIVLMPNLVLWTVLVGHGLRVAELSVLDLGCHEGLVLKFSFFCLLVFNGLLGLGQGAERGVLVSCVDVHGIRHISQLGLLESRQSLVALRMVVLLSSLFK